MATKNLWLEPFDPAAEYVARKVLKVGAEGGKHRLLHPGQAVPKNHFDARRLRQLYDIRAIVKRVVPEVQDDGVAGVVTDVVADAVAVDEPTFPEASGPVTNDASGYAIERAGGWAYIRLNGERIEGPIRRNIAEERLAALNAGV